MGTKCGGAIKTALRGCFRWGIKKTRENAFHFPSRRAFSAAALTDDFQKSGLALHRVRVQLAHVPSLIGLPDVLDVQGPGPLVAVGDRDPMVLGDDVSGDGEDRLRVDSQPRYLKPAEGIVIRIVSEIAPAG